MRFALFVTTVLFSTMSFAGDGLKKIHVRAMLASIEAQASACHDKAVATNEMKQCSYAKLDRAESLMNSLYTQLSSDLEASAKTDTDMARNGKSMSQETLDRLVTSQKSFISYRDAQCEYQASDMLDGSGEGVITSGCLADKTVERVKELSYNLFD